MRRPRKTPVHLHPCNGGPYDGNKLALSRGDVHTARFRVAGRLGQYMLDRGSMALQWREGWEAACTH